MEAGESPLIVRFVETLFPPSCREVALMLAALAGPVMRSVSRPPAPTGEKTSLKLAAQLAALELRRDRMRFRPRAAGTGLAIIAAFPLVGMLLLFVVDALFRINAPKPFHFAAAWPIWAPTAR
jgi:hypothetical protein